jgi:hypothetical protein
MYTNTYLLQSYTQDRIERLHREAEDRRLAQLAAAVEASVVDSASCVLPMSTPFGWSARLLAPLRLL